VCRSRQTLGVMTTDMSSTQWIEIAALALVEQNDMDEIEKDLVHKGCPVALAEKLTLLIPSAFAAEHFEPAGIPFSPSFFVGSVGNFRERLYRDEPVYGEARRLAARWVEEGRLSLIERVLDWSAEADGIRTAIAKGLTPSRIEPVHHGFES